MQLDVVEVAGEVWFYVPSLAMALGHEDQRDLLRAIPGDEQVTDSLRVADSVRQAQFLTEPGFYRAVFSADAAIAEPLKRWVTQEVLPSIRVTGQYRLHMEARRLGVRFDFSQAQWEWLKLHPYMVDVLPLAAAGFNSVEITRALSYSTPSGITARKRIEKLKELKFLPKNIEPRTKKLERLIAEDPAEHLDHGASVPATSISEGDRILLDNFHAAPAQVQAGVKTALGAFAPAGGIKNRKRAA